MENLLLNDLIIVFGSDFYLQTVLSCYIDRLLNILAFTNIEAKHQTLLHCNFVENLTKLSDIYEIYLVHRKFIKSLKKLIHYFKYIKK